MTGMLVPDQVAGRVPLPLHAYAAVILGEALVPTLADCQTVEETSTDGGLSVCRAVTTCIFANGVVIRRTVEEDLEAAEVDQHPGDVCRECWIAYEVLADRGEVGVQPTRIRFGSRCRERFWLRYMTA